MRGRGEAGLPWAAGIGVAVALFVATPSIARACTCASPRPDVGAALAGADLVVEARVEAHAFVLGVGWRTRLKVAKTHKGVHAARLVITASKTCAVPFEVGTRYLVYANEDGDGGFATTYCSRTMPLRDAALDLERIASGEAAGAPAERTAAPAWTLRSPLPAGWTDADLARLVPLLAIFRR